MDAKDFRLLVALHEDARAGYRSLGRRVSLTAPAVRDRLARLQAKGIFHGFWLTPDPQVLGREDLLVLFSGERTRADLETVLAAADVAWAAWKVDGGLTVQVWPRNPENALKELASLLEAAPSGHTLAGASRHETLTGMDWRILDALVDDPRLPLDELCKRTGLSPKTVRKHLARMREDQSVYITPKLGSLGESGEIVFPLLVYGDAKAAHVQQIVGDAFLLNATEVPPMKYFLCRVPDMSQVTERVQKVRKVEGVESAVVTINRELVVNTAFIHRMLREQIVSAGTPRHSDESATGHAYGTRAPASPAATRSRSGQGRP